MLIANVVKEFKKEILILILVIVAIVFYFKLKKDNEKNKIAKQITDLVKGNNFQNNQISEALGVEGSRISALRKISYSVAFELGTLPTQNTFFNTEDEEEVIYNLNLLNSDDEIIAVAEFYKELTHRNLKVDLDKYLSTSQLEEVELYTSL